MKKIFVTILCFATGYAFAQTPTVDQKKQAIKVVDELIYNFMQYSVSKQSKDVPKFKKLFAPGATIPNEIVPDYFYGGDWSKANPEKIRNVSIEDYFQKITEIYPEGYDIVKFKNSAIDYSKLNNNQVRIIFKKNITAFTKTGLQLEANDTIQLNINLTADFSAALINKIDLLGHKLTHINDDDMDFVSNDKDKCPGIKGLNSPDGCRTAQEQAEYDAWIKKLKENHEDSLRYVGDIPGYNSKIKSLVTLAAQPPHYWLNAGIAAGMVSATFTDATYGYNNPAVGKTNNPTTTFSSGNFVQGNLGVNYFFGEKANFGVGLGIGYNMISGTATKSAFHTEYEANDKWSTSSTTGVYRQLISSVGSIKEKQSYSNLVIPITLIYKGDINEKFGYSVEAGLLYNASYSSTMSSTDASFNYEAIYQFSGTPGSPTTNYNDPTATDWLITLNPAGHQSALNVDYINKMHNEGFNVGYHLTPGTTNKAGKFAGSMGFVFKPSVAYKLNETTKLNVGLYVSASSFKPSTTNSNYQLVDNNVTTVNYNTLMNGVSNISNTMYGINITLVKAIFFNPKKWKDQIDATKVVLQDETNKLNQLQNKK